jgi:bifunctional UDP-N-acetylglucosamine pyrophosphorylase/glucosamine-1-phosphate N-acetyltransferase
LRKDSMTGSLILAAGRGTRMKGYEGNKTLLPLVPDKAPFEGRRPILMHILQNLPPGPKAVVVHHKKEAVIEATRSLGLSYYEQAVLSGTGGALLAARHFLELETYDQLLITMGDIPLVKPVTYRNLMEALKSSSLAVLGFQPADKKQYGVLEFDGPRVKRIVEWKYWRSFPAEARETLQICNSGIYAARKSDLVDYLPILEERPHSVLKEKNGKPVQINEFFITDLVELMYQDGVEVGCVLAHDENEVMGVDDLPSLIRVQKLFQEAGS